MAKHILVCGAGGFIGSHLTKTLASNGARVVGIDIKKPEYGESSADEFIIGDLRDQVFCRGVLSRRRFDEVYQLAANMGGAGFIFDTSHDAEILSSSLQINLNIANAFSGTRSRVFFASSACVYPAFNQTDPDNPVCVESTVYPAQPDSEYGWEKLISERIYLAFVRSHDLDARIARLHNVYGPEGTWRGGREKAPAAICRKVALADDGECIDVWGDGAQTRSFLYISDCIDAILELMRSNFRQPVNIGSTEKISIEQLANLIISISGKALRLRYVAGAQGVRGRTSDNALIEQVLGWSQAFSITEGLRITYPWVAGQVSLFRNGNRSVG